MTRKNLLAASLAAVMTIGALAPAMPVKADSQSTTITLGVATKNQYTMIIPSSTELNHDGTAKAMTNGLTIKCEHQTKDVVVTLTSYNEWNLKADDISTLIGYSVYTDESATTECKTVEFTKTEIMKSNSEGALTGTTKDIYVKFDAEDFDAAEGGNYSDTITFTATLKAETSLKETVIAKVEAVQDTIKKDGTGKTLIEYGPTAIDDLRGAEFSVDADGTYVFVLAADNKLSVKVTIGADGAVTYTGYYDGALMMSFY